MRRTDSPVAALELIRARQLSASRLAADAGHERFALMFRATRGAALVQSTYSFEHRQMGALSRYLSCR